MSQNELVLYGYWRSSASWRVRWALAYKNIPYRSEAVNLLKGEHRSESNLKRNPSGFVPTLQLENSNEFLSQSMAILTYLDMKYPQPSLFPADPLNRARVLGLCEIINADTAPLQKPMVAQKHSADESIRLEWTQYWIREGLKAFDKASLPFRSKFSFGEDLSAADLFLVPQIYNAIRYQINITDEFPELFGIYERSLNLESCRVALPENQKDAPSQ